MILRPYFETLGVVLLALAGALIGRRMGKARPPYWPHAFLAPLALVAAIALSRWIPQLEFVAPFRWLLADRTEFALLALACAVMVAIPQARVPGRRLQVLLALLMCAFIGVHCLPPFLLPGLNYSYLRSLKTVTDQDGICRQCTGYTCGPASAVTALRRLGLPAEEGELAILAHTTESAGTPCDSLCAAIERRYQKDGILCTYRRFNSVSELRGCEPVLAVVKFSFLVDHYITVLRITATDVEVGDPLNGLQTLSYGAFAGEWRNCGIVVRRTPEGRRWPPPRAEGSVDERTCQ